jgi:hypothetical protein
LTYDGSSLIQSMKKDLIKFLKDDGFKNVQEAVACKINWKYERKTEKYFYYWSSIRNR